MSAAVVPMAYGSPERLDDVSACVADIHGDGPIAPEHRKLVFASNALEPVVA